MSNRQLYGEPLRLRQYRPLAEPSPSLWATLRVAWGRHRSRRRIAQLDPQMLKDIGGRSGGEQAVLARLSADGRAALPACYPMPNQST